MLCVCLCESEREIERETRQTAREKKAEIKYFEAMSRKLLMVCRTVFVRLFVCHTIGWQTGIHCNQKHTE